MRLKGDGKCYKLTLGSGGGGTGFFFLLAPGFLATLLVVRFVGAIVNAVLLLCSAVCGRLGSA